MTLEELLAALETAQAELAKDPENAELKAKVEEAKKAYETEKAKSDDPDDDDSAEMDESKLDEKTKRYLAKLRKENANHRSKAKDLKSKLSESEEKRRAILKAAGIEDESDTPEQKLKAREAELEQIAVRQAILELAIQNGVNKDNLEFFEFLVSKEAQKLGEGEELGDEQIAEIVKKVKKSGSKGTANSTVEGGKNPPPSGGPTEVTLDKFVRMSISEKSLLYEKNRDLYERLVQEAKAKKKLI